MLKRSIAKRFLLAMFLTLILASCSFAYDLSFLLVNNSGARITDVWVMPHTHKQGSWIKVVMDPLRNGQSINIKRVFEGYGSNRYWNLCLKFQDRRGGTKTLSWKKIDLPNVEKITAIYNKGYRLRYN